MSKNQRRARLDELPPSPPRSGIVRTPLLPRGPPSPNGAGLPTNVASPVSILSPDARGRRTRLQRRSSTRSNEAARASYAFALEIAGVISYLTVVHHCITAATAPIPSATPVHPIRIVWVVRCFSLF